MIQRGLVRPFLLLAALVLASTFVLAACGDDDEEGTATPTPASGAIDISNVPELADGKLQIGSDIAYAPIEFYIEGTETPDGLDVDLAKAMGKALGVDVEFINSGFDGLIAALQSEDFDVVMSAMTVNEERQKEIDFVDYVIVGTGVLVPAGNPGGIKTLDDLCGITVAVQLGTIQVDLVEAQSAKCDKKIDIVTFDTNPLAVEDLRTGGADANLSDFPVAFVDAEESDGDLEVLDLQIDPAPYGIGLRKSSTELKTALDEALRHVMDSGDYDKILEKWSLTAAALP